MEETVSIHDEAEEDMRDVRFKKVLLCLMTGSLLDTGGTDNSNRGGAASHDWCKPTVHPKLRATRYR